MSAPSVDPADLLDLKLMPAWVKEPSTREDYAEFEGEDRADRRERDADDRGDRRRMRPNRARQPDKRRKGGPRDRARDGREQVGHRPQRQQNRPPPKPEVPLQVGVGFLPRTPVLDNVIGQIKAEALAYSLFFLARSFLEKPPRYEVLLKATPETPLYRLGETGGVSTDRAFLESNAFRLAHEKFYRVEISQSEPVKGNFTSVARCRLSGTVLGPPNHHDYQRKLRNLYEQRFSRRMNFAEYQRQIENVTDPAAVEQWKEQARTVTTYVTLNEEPPVTFPNSADAERHFRQNYLPSLVQSSAEVTVDGVNSRILADRRLRRHIEEAWSAENRSPSHIMQELAKRFRDVGLQIFRHRRGMLFVSSIRVRPFAHEEQAVSEQVKAILNAVSETPRIRRKELAEKILGELAEDVEARKLSLASDLRWLISEGYLIEFNDGAFDLPRAKAKKAEEVKPESVRSTEAPLPETEAAVDSVSTPAEPEPPIRESVADSTPEQTVPAAAEPALVDEQPTDEGSGAAVDPGGEMPPAPTGPS